MDSAAPAWAAAGLALPAAYAQAALGVGPIVASLSAWGVARWRYTSVLVGAAYVSGVLFLSGAAWRDPLLLGPGAPIVSVVPVASLAVLSTLLVVSVWGMHRRARWAVPLYPSAVLYGCAVLGAQVLARRDDVFATAAASLHFFLSVAVALALLLSISTVVCTAVFYLVSHGALYDGVEDALQALLARLPLLSVAVVPLTAGVVASLTLPPSVSGAWRHAAIGATFLFSAALCFLFARYVTAYHAKRAAFELFPPHLRPYALSSPPSAGGPSWSLRAFMSSDDGLSRLRAESAAAFLLLPTALCAALVQGALDATLLRSLAPRLPLLAVGVLSFFGVVVSAKPGADLVGLALFRPGLPPSHVRPFPSRHTRYAQMLRDAGQALPTLALAADTGAAVAAAAAVFWAGPAAAVPPALVLRALSLLVCRAAMAGYPRVDVRLLVRVCVGAFVVLPLLAGVLSVLLMLVPAFFPRPN